jgi:glycosyltransferase involved in cell wall biosynthesis
VLLSPHVQNADGSKFFGSPTKLFEYMAMEKPIIASRLEQIEQVLSTEHTSGNLKIAELYEPNNRLEFIESFKALVENLDSSSVMVKNCRSEALKKYTWTTHVDKIITSIENLA